MPTPVTRVVFLVHLIEAWDSYHDLVRAMEEADDFEPVVISMPRHFKGDTGLGFEDEVHQGLTRAGVAHLRFTPADMGGAVAFLRSIAPDLIFRQSQWDADIAAELGTEHLGFTRTGLVPYETMNIVQNVATDGTGNSAVDSPYHRAAWVVFCANDMLLDMARRDGARQGAQFKVAGHPKADRLRGAVGAWPVPDPGESPGHGGHPGTTGHGGRRRRRRIAWSAHHTIGQGWTDFGAFPLMAAEMLAWARESTDENEFVFLPHPALIPYTDSVQCPVTRAEFNEWRQAWLALPTTAVVTEGYAPVLAASDLLVTDGLSLLLEYQLLGRPLLFFERRGHRPFNAIGEVVRQGAHTARTVPEVRQLAGLLLDGRPDPLRPTQAAMVDRLFGPPGSAGRILGILREMLGAERAGVDGPGPGGVACRRGGQLPV